MATRVTTNPSSVIPNISGTGLSQMDTQGTNDSHDASMLHASDARIYPKLGDSTDGIGSATVGSTDLTRDHAAFGESATNLPNSGPDVSSNYKTHNIDDVAKLFGVPLNSSRDIEEFVQDLQLGKHELWPLLSKERSQEITDIVCNSKVSPSNHIVRSVDINAKSTSYAGTAGVIVKKVSTRFEHTLYGYFIGKRMAFPVVDYYARNNWAKHGLKKIMMNSKGFFFFKFDSRAGLEAILEGGPWMIRNSPIILKKWSMDTRLLKEELTRIPIWVKLHDVPIQVFEEDEADLVDFVTIGIPSLTGDDFTKETIRVEYEWKPCNTPKLGRSGI
ncbi:zinc knuckle CX2CX4HX4C containing protein [Tanacetum coccineum]